MLPDPEDDPVDDSDDDWGTLSALRFHHPPATPWPEPNLSTYPATDWPVVVVGDEAARWRPLVEAAHARRLRAAEIRAEIAEREAAEEAARLGRQAARRRRRSSTPAPDVEAEPLPEELAG